jgi:LysM repeat protein
VTTVPASALADQARKHLGEDGPLDTCVSNGSERWARELGLATLGTASVTEARRLAKAGHNGWRYHEGTAGLARGHVADWDPKALGDADARHVCVVDEVDGDRWRGIGSGTPSGKVARQPASGGFNPKSVLVGYLIAPTETAAAAPAKAPAAPAKAPAKAGGEYVVKSGDYLLRIAAQHDTTVKAILAANPPLPTRRPADYHIAAPNLILVGQRIRLP